MMIAKRRYSKKFPKKAVFRLAEKCSEVKTLFFRDNCTKVFIIVTFKYSSLFQEPEEILALKIELISQMYESKYLPCFI